MKSGVQAIAMQVACQHWTARVPRPGLMVSTALSGGQDASICFPRACDPRQGAAQGVFATNGPILSLFGPLC